MTDRAHHEYQGGPWTAVAGGELLALVEPDAPWRLVDGLWQVARGDGDVLGALGVVAADGFAVLPAFALVRTEADGSVHAVLRGPVRLRLHGADGAQEVAARDGAVWTEHRALGVQGLEVLVDDAPEAPWWPLVAGVVRAGAVRNGATEVASVRPDTATHEQPVVPAPDAPSVAPEPVAVAAEPEPVAEREPVPDPEPVVVADSVVVPEPVVMPEPEPAVVAEQAVAPEVLVEPEPPVVVSEPLPESHDVDVVPEPEPWYVADVEHLTVAPHAGSADHGMAGWPVAPALAEVAHFDEVAPVATSTHVEAGTALDDPAPAADAEVGHDIPWWPLTTSAGVEAPAVPAAPAVLAPVVTAEPDVLEVESDDHDGMTILSSDLARLRDRLPAWSQDAVPGPFPTPEAEPLPARMVLSTGLVVVLDRAVLLGRAPQVSRVTNRELPRLVTVPSPNQDISRTHAEVRVEGEHVVVTDLDSTNGVHVSRPGEGVRRLHPGEPSVVGTDEVVDLGDGVTFTVERSAP
ncbi:FHA domain-containing protein [Cellulomonas xiejunii]|uniref:FHA domain-containing protein n=1 Tax=Cellulomonas xiejunii TaxID=2968083 RepID=UPI001D0E51AA|nr:FHA domain-containing protein [Cellulomonas xiejunii]MCC2313368.1 FHA domain-containing protein [Cellulomonas xiejunii]